MATISTQLRNLKELTKDQLTEAFFSIPPRSIPTDPEKAPKEGVEKMDINAVLSLGVAGEEDSYVSCFLPLPLSQTWRSRNEKGPERLTRERN